MNIPSFLLHINIHLYVLVSAHIEDHICGLGGGGGWLELKLSNEYVANALASQYLSLVLYNVQAYIKMLFRVSC